MSNRVGGHRGEWRGRERDSREKVSLRSQCSCPCPPPPLPNVSPLSNVLICCTSSWDRTLPPPRRRRLRCRTCRYTSLLRMSAWSEWFWMPEGAMLLISRLAGKPCSSSSQMWLSAAPGGVIGGDAVCVIVIWIWCRPPCECWRSSFPSASPSTIRRRLMPLGWRSGEK